MLTQERLKELLHYDPETGVFTRRVRTSNNNKVGDVPGYINPDGYRVVMIGGRNYPAQRLAIFYMTGQWPDGDVDHKDRDRQNNSWENLRPATRAQNNANSGARKDNRLGIKGVRLNGAGSYTAQITINGKPKHLGSFTTSEDAHAAYVKAANDNFGEFARAA